jgi:large subunit ribosomal protein L30
MGKNLRIILRKSMIGRRSHQRQVLAGLGLRRIDQAVIRTDSAAIRGMIAKVSHLVEVQRIDEEAGG